MAENNTPKQGSQNPPNQGDQTAKIAADKAAADKAAADKAAAEELADKAAADKAAADKAAADKAAADKAAADKAAAEELADFYGNKDTEKAFLLPADYKKSIVVHQCQIESMNGGIFEVPNSHQVQTYNPAVYEKLTESNFFSESKMKVVILHDPR